MFLTRHLPHPRIDLDGHGIEDPVDAHPLLPGRLLGSVERLADQLLAYLQHELMDGGGRVGIAGTLVGRERVQSSV